MKVKFLMVSCGLLVFAAACNNSSESKATEDTAKAAPVDTTTAVAPAPVETAPAIDSAAITKEYLAARKSSKSTAKAKKQGDNEVVMYAEPTMPSHEALEQPPAKKDVPVVIHTKEYVYFTPAQKPSFVGGDAALSAFINKNLVYPEEALRYHVEGTVFAEVYLDSVGTVTSVEVPGKHLGSGLEEETISVLMRSPRWHPAKENGQMVKSKLTVPVTYKIQH